MFRYGLAERSEFAIKFYIIILLFLIFRLTMKQLVRNLGDQFNLPTTAIKNLDLDTFVDNAIKVEAGELETLRVCLFQYHGIVI